MGSALFSYGDISRFSWTMIVLILFHSECLILYGAILKTIGLTYYMGESFQDYSKIQDFEADFSKKVSIKMLN